MERNWRLFQQSDVFPSTRYRRGWQKRVKVLARTKAVQVAVDLSAGQARRQVGASTSKAKLSSGESGLPSACAESSLAYVHMENDMMRVTNVLPEHGLVQ